MTRPISNDSNYLIPYILDDIEEKVQQNNYKKLIKLIENIGKIDSLEYSSLTCRRIIRLLEIPTAVPQELILKTLELFTKKELIMSALDQTDLENVSFHCQDGVVNISKLILINFSDYYKTLFSSQMRESQPKDGKFILDYSQYSKSVVQALREYYYGDAIKLMPINDYLDLYALAFLINENKLKKTSKKLFDKFLKKCTVAKLETLFEYLEIQVEKFSTEKFISLKREIINAFLKKNDIRYTQQNYKIYLYLHDFWLLLEKSFWQSVLPDYVKGIYISSNNETQFKLFALLPKQKRQLVKEVMFDFSCVTVANIEDLISKIPNVTLIIHLYSSLDFKSISSVSSLKSKKIKLLSSLSTHVMTIDDGDIKIIQEVSNKMTLSGLFKLVLVCHSSSLSIQELLGVIQNCSLFRRYSVSIFSNLDKQIVLERKPSKEKLTV